MLFGKPSLDQESGDYIMNERRKQLAMELAGNNPARYAALKDDLDSRSEQNKQMFNEYGNIRPDTYTDPFQRKPQQPKGEEPKVRTWNDDSSWGLEANSRHGMPTDFGRTYWDEGPSTSPNYEYTPSEEARKHVMAMTPEQRKKYNEMAGAM